jgi:hypothetical protein
MAAARLATGAQIALLATKARSRRAAALSQALSLTGFKVGPETMCPKKRSRATRANPVICFWRLSGNRSTVSERTYLLALLFGHEFEVAANEFSLQIASSAMMMVETDRSPGLIACADLVAAEDDGT